MSSAPPATLVPLAPAHVDAAAATLEAAFGYESEYSWSRPLGLPRERFAFWLQHMYLPARVKASPPSLVALVGDTLAGVLTLEDVNEKEEEEAGAAQEQPPGMAAIDAILHECKDAFFAAFEANGGDAAQARQAHGLLGYFAFLGVDASARRRGVGAVLIERGVAELRRAGFTYGVAFCTSRFSAALFARAGFSRWGGVSYQAFAMPDGTHPFETLPKDECAVMVMRLRGAEDAPAAPRCS